MYQYRAKLIGTIENAIYDADTIKVRVDLGFGINFALGPCRLVGINAPEMRGVSRTEGLISRDYVRSVFKDVDWFTINSIKDSGDKYGRYLVEVILPDGTNLNEKLIELGHAVRY